MKKPDPSPAPNAGALNDLVKASLLRASTDMGWPFRVARFVGVGGLSSAIYVLVVSLTVEIAAFDPKWASITGYLVSMPLSFFGHREFTFRSANEPFWEMVRFAILHGINMSVALASMYAATELLGHTHWVGSLFAVLFVPMSTFVIMNFWVFAQPKK